MNASIFLISFFSMNWPGSKSLTSPAIWASYPVGSNLVIRPIPDWPAQIAFQVLSTPVPSGVTSPKPVTTMRLFPRSFIDASRKLGFFLDVIESFAHRENLFGVLIWNLDAEFFFERHDKLNSIQRVRPEVFDETRLGRHFIFLNSELLCDDFLHPFVYCSHKRAVLLPDRVGSSAVLSSAASPYQDMSIPPLTCST